MRAAAIAMKRSNSTLQVLLLRSLENDWWSYPEGPLARYENEAAAALRELEEQAGYKGQPEREPIAFYVSDGYEGVACVLVRHARKTDEPRPGSHPAWVAVSRAFHLLKEERSPKQVEPLLFVLGEAAAEFLVLEAKDADPHQSG